MADSGSREARDIARDGLLAMNQERTPSDNAALDANADSTSTAPKATARAITINFITGGLGSAIFSLPWSLAGSSIFSAVIITGLVLMVNAWTISIIVRAAEKYQAFDLGSVISHLPGGMGKPLQVVTNLCVWLCMFFTLVSYIIVIHDSALPFLGLSEADMLKDGRRLEIVALASLLVLPLCFLNQQWLERTSSIAVLINLYLFILVGFFFTQKAVNHDRPEGCCALGWTVRGNFAMVTVMFQAVIIQMCVLPMYQELEDRSPAKFDRIVATGFSALFFIFCGFATFAYLLVGPEVDNDVLKNLPTNGWSNAAKLGVIFVVACVYPIMVYPMIAPLQSGDLVNSLGRWRGPAISFAKVAIVLCVLVVSACVKSLGVVNIINGAMSAGIFVALLPSVVGLLLLDVGPCHKIALVLLLVFGLCVSGAGFVFSNNYVDDLKCFVEL